MRLDNFLINSGLNDHVTSLLMYAHHSDEVDVILLRDRGDWQRLSVIGKHSLKHAFLDYLGN